MIIDDVSEVLLSAEKFRELYDRIQNLYYVVNACHSAVKELDTLLGTAVKENISAKRLEAAQIEEFKRGFSK